MANITDIINALNVEGYVELTNDEDEWIEITEEPNSNFRYIVSWNSNIVRTYDFERLISALEWDLAQSSFDIT